MKRGMNVYELVSKHFILILTTYNFRTIFLGRYPPPPPKKKNTSGRKVTHKLHLVYGESKKEHESASKHRVFKLGKKCVCERLEYDHVGVKACVLQSDDERVGEKIWKG